MTVTLTEVAREAEVSLATASRAFRASDLLAADTRQRVIDAAFKLGYNVPAQFRTRTFAVIVPDVSSPIYAALIKTFQNKAWPGRHRMILGDTDEDPARELEFLESLARDVDGVILCSPRSAAADARKAVGDTPLVVLNGESAGSPVIVMDVEPGLRQAVEHLKSLGHEHVVYVPGPAASWANRTRHGILERLTAEHGLALSVVGNQSASIQGGVAAAAAVLASGAAAVVAYNDLVALGIQSGAKVLGSECPADLSIVGIDNVPFAASVAPGLTTVRMDIDRSAALSLEFLMNVIEGKPPVPGPAVRFGSQLIVRGSTARA